MFVAGIILLAVGFLGVLIGAKTKQMPIAMISAIVMIVGLGMYTYKSLNDDGADMEDAIIYQCAIMDQSGAFLKKNASGQKVVMIVDPTMDSYENGKKLLQAKVEAFEKAYGKKPDVVKLEVEGLAEEDGGSIIDNMKAADFEKIVAANSDAGIFLIDIGLPSGDVPDFGEAKVFLLNTGMADDKDLKNAIEDEKIIGLVTTKSGKIDPEFTPDEDDLKGAFDSRYVIYGKHNIDKMK